MSGIAGKTGPRSKADGGRQSAASRTSSNGMPSSRGSASGSVGTEDAARSGNIWPTRLLNEVGLSVPEVAEILGHSDIKTTMIYLAPHKGKLADRMASIES